MRGFITLFLITLMAVSAMAASGDGSAGLMDEDKGMGEGNDGDQGQGAPVNDMADPNKEQTETETMQKEPPVEPIMAKVRAENTEQLKEMIQTKKQEMEKEMEQLKDKEQKVYQNQNRVREAVHAMLAMEDLVGGIGEQVSAVAKTFENSVQNTIKAEEKIQSKGGFARFFTGGDHKSAEAIEAEVMQNMERIKELKQLKEQCQCEEEVQNLFQEQIALMEQEQTRLGELAVKEQKSKGIIGWIWK